MNNFDFNLEYENLENEFVNFLKETKENFERLDYEKNIGKEKVLWNKNENSLPLDDSKSSSVTENISNKIDSKFIGKHLELEKVLSSKSDSKKNHSSKQNSNSLIKFDLKGKQKLEKKSPVLKPKKFTLYEDWKNDSLKTRASSDEEDDKENIPSDHSINLQPNNCGNSQNNPLEDETDIAFIKYISQMKQKLKISPTDSDQIINTEKDKEADVEPSKNYPESEKNISENDSKLSDASFRLLQFVNESSKHFLQRRESLSLNLYQFFNEVVFNSRLPKDLPVRWTSSLRTTAGQTNCVRKDGVYDCSIVLAYHILTTFERLRDTLLHEMCHAACWIVNKNRCQHGPLWQTWAARCHLVFPEISVPTRCHNYEISHKLTYRCLVCEWKLGREKKLSNLERRRCPKCSQPIVLSR